MKVVQVKQLIIGNGRPKIVVPIRAVKATAIIEEAYIIARSTCDLVEWRADYFEEVENTSAVLTLIAQLTTILQNKPLLFTFRTKKEGGASFFSENAYAQLYKTILQQQLIDLIDIELFINETIRDDLIISAKTKQVKTVLCHHDFKQTPTKKVLLHHLCNMQELGADICKIAVMPNCTMDVLTVLTASTEMKNHYAKGPFVTISMGELGKISRFSGELFGSALTFGTIVETSAPGQMPLSELQHQLTMMSLQTMH